MITLPPGTRAACWVRVSSDGQVRDESPAVHLQRTQEYCELQGWPVVEVYKLDAVSGAAVMDHPETKRMLRDVEAGRIDALVFSAVARVGRDLLELLTIEKHLRTHGARLVSTRRGVIDTSTPEGMSAFVNEGARAQDERLELSARVRAGLKQRAKMGQFTAAVAPYGYRKVQAGPTGRAKKLEIDPVEGPVRALMYELYLQHRRLSPVAAELNDRGYRARSGKPFTGTQVKYILLDPTAKGVYYVNRVTRRGKPDKPDSEWLPVPAPALIESAIWQRCHDLLRANHRPARRAFYPYSGLVFCGCGPKMYVRAARDNEADLYPPRYKCRGCGNKIELQELDRAMGNLFRGFLLDGLPDDVESQISPAEAQLKGLRTELKQVLAGKKRWAEAYQAGALSLDEFTGYHAPLVERERAITAQIARIEAEQKSDKEQMAAQELAAQLLREVAWSDLEPGEKQALLREFVQRITLSASDISINLLYTPAALQLSEPGFAKLHTITIGRSDYTEPADQRAWGYCIRKARLKRGESVDAAAEKMGVSTEVLLRWEMLVQAPAPAQIPGAIDYLGYVPWSRTPYAQSSLGQAVRAIREIRGLMQSDLCALLGTSQGTISRLENDSRLSKRLLDRLEQTLEIQLRRVFGNYQGRIEYGV